MYLAYNKVIQSKIIDQKAELMAETLETLSTSKISAFFKYIRETCETLPADGVLKRILKTKAKEYSKAAKVLDVPLIAPESLPDAEWLANFWAGLKLVQMGKMTPKDVKKELGI